MSRNAAEALPFTIRPHHITSVYHPLMTDVVLLEGDPVEHAVSLAESFYKEGLDVANARFSRLRARKLARDTGRKYVHPDYYGDVVGVTPESFAENMVATREIFSDFLYGESGRPVVIAPENDIICNACAIGKHCLRPNIKAEMLHSERFMGWVAAAGLSVEQEGNSIYTDLGTTRSAVEFDVRQQNEQFIALENLN